MSQHGTESPPEEARREWWSSPRTMKEFARRVDMSPRRLKKFLQKHPGSFRRVYHTCYQLRLDLLPEVMRGRLDDGAPGPRGA